MCEGSREGAVEGKDDASMKTTEKGKKNKAGSGALSRPAGSAPLWIACRTLLAGHEEEFFYRWKKVADTFQEDDVHDLRVASRRLREGLALFSPCLPAKRSGRVDKEVKKVTRMLGELRNTDEACSFFSALTPQERAHSRHEIEQLLAALKSEREQAHQKLKKELGSLNPKPLQGEFRSLDSRTNLFRNSAVDPFMSMACFAGDAIMERAGTLRELLPRAVQEQDSEAQHLLRIAVKKMRYRLEIIEPLLRRDYQELHGALKGYQDVLGKLHDIDVFCEMVQERLRDGAGREELLRVMAKRRSRLHASFMKKLQSFPIESIGAQARDALRS